MRILIIDDFPDSGELIQQILTERGHEAVIARNADEAVNACRQSHFDLLIVDIGLPDRDGWQLMGELRAFCDTPAIAISGYAQRFEVRRSKEAGFLYHLLKPLSLDEFEIVMKRMEATLGFSPSM